MNAHFHKKMLNPQACNFDGGSDLFPAQIIYWPFLYRVPCIINPWYWQNSDAVYMQSSISVHTKVSKHGGAYANLH